MFSYCALSCSASTEKYAMWTLDNRFVQRLYRNPIFKTCILPQNHLKIHRPVEILWLPQFLTAQLVILFRTSVPCFKLKWCKRLFIWTIKSIIVIFPNGKSWSGKYQYRTSRAQMNDLPKKLGWSLLKILNQIPVETEAEPHKQKLKAGRVQMKDTGQTGKIGFVAIGLPCP